MPVCRPVSLASAATAVIASLTTVITPAHAGEQYPLPPYTSAANDTPTYSSGDTIDGSWAGTYTDLNGHTAEAQFNGTFIGESRFVTSDGRTLYREGEHSWREADTAAPDFQKTSYAAPRDLPSQPGARPLGYSNAEREGWLAECRRRDADNGLGGALIGGLIGGFAGNRIAGRGNRAVGTIAGAAIGAVAGAVIDKSEDTGRVRDGCEAYLERYEAGYGADYGQAYAYAPQYGYGNFGYPSGCQTACAPVQWAPMAPRPAMQQVRKVVCQPKQKVVYKEEWVDEDVSYAAAPAKRVPVKTVKIQQMPVKTKTVPIKRSSVKYVK